MADEPRVVQLLDEILDSERTPEEVCSSYPELLPEVRQRWQQMRLVEAQLNAMFPSPETKTDGDRPDSWHPGAELPRIPGYEVESVLGRGGVGIVFKAWHLRLHRPVALKMLLAGAYAGLPELARFQREVEAEAGLRHPNIVQVYDVGEHEGRPYFTMEFVEGGSLAETFSGTPQPARQSAVLVATLARAVQVAHQGGIVHRDLKPANILLAGDGTPKITDFGLARRLQGEVGLTQSGAVLGTPSYMAPEQAQGKPQAVGPGTDIYALGAILYELLTGRPPFRGETAAETVQQVLFQEPVAPSRLNAKVPRDLETICLKCLRKETQRRYASGAALADDLQRYLRGEPIVARPTGRLERLGKWVRRRPSQAAMLAASLLAAVALVAAGLWFVAQEARQREAAEADLKEVTRLRDSARWTEASDALKRAETRLGSGGLSDLRGQLDQARRDLDLVYHLDTIRLKHVTRSELTYSKARADPDYEDAFREAGLGTVNDPAQSVAAIVKASPVREALIAALDDWAICTTDAKRRAWLLDVVRHADPDAASWRERLLDPAVWENPAALSELTRTAPVAGLPVSLLLALGDQLRAVGGDSVPFLKRVQGEHPTDFWANLILGNAMVQWAPLEAGGYYRAALASRPGAAVGYCVVGDALRIQKLLDEAIDYYEKAIRIDANYARAYSNIGLALEDQGRTDEAIDYYEKSLRLDPDYPWAHHNLGNALRVKGRLDEACDHYQQVVRLDPNNREVQVRIRSVLLRQGRGRELQVSWRKALDAGPREHDAWFGYAELCLFLGLDGEYRRARRDLLDRFGASTEPFVAERTSRACLLLQATGDELLKAAALADRAVAAKGSVQNWVHRYFLFAKGLAEYRQGRLESAISIMNGEASRALGPAPRLIVAMAQHGLGRKREARHTLAAAVLAFDWSAAHADNRDCWICHVLRREAEALVLPNLPAFLEGNYRPQENDERLAMLGTCQFQGLNLAAARLYTDAFAVDPTLAENVTTECRYRAARCAALAGCGLGADGSRLDEAERTRWRRQAREWLEADLAAWTQKVDRGGAADRALVRRALASWRADPDLAAVRELTALERLPADERGKWLAMWNEVDAVTHRAQMAR
jgi:serine/threonine-protein kinase